MRLLLTRPGSESSPDVLADRYNSAAVPSGLLNPALLAGATSPGACRSGAPPGANSTIAASQIVTKRHRTYGVSHPVGVPLLSPGRLTRCRRVAPPAGGRAGDPPVQYRGESHSRGSRKGVGHPPPEPVSWPGRRPGENGAGTCGPQPAHPTGQGPSRSRL